MLNVLKIMIVTSVFSSAFGDIGQNGSFVQGEVLSVRYSLKQRSCVGKIMISNEIPVYSNKNQYFKNKPISSVKIADIDETKCLMISNAIEASSVMDLFESITDFTGFISLNDFNDFFNYNLKIKTFDQKDI